MIDWKAVAIGLVATVIIGLINQLAFTSIATAIIAFGSNYSFLHENQEALLTLSGMSLFCVAMTVGGGVTAYIARHNRAFNALTVGILAAAISIITSLSVGGVTTKGALLAIAGVVCAGIGGLLVQKRVASPSPG